MGTVEGRTVRIKEKKDRTTSRTTTMGDNDGNTVVIDGGDCYRTLALVFALVFPPISVFMVNGLGLHLLINIVLFLLGFIPAIIHALWLVLKADSADSHAKADAQAVA